MNDNKDLLATIEYEIHHKFYFSLVISLSITLLTTIALSQLTFFFNYVNLIMNQYFRYPFLFLTLTNNIYQVYAHVFTGSKFAGYNGIVPHGSRDKQSL